MRRIDAARPLDHDAASRSNPDVRLMIERLATILSDDAPAATLRLARQQFEREYVALVLRRHHGRVGEAARALGIQRTNLYRKARQLGIPMRHEQPRTAPGED
jgi:DNA-binding NtrC family response regulator